MLDRDKKILELRKDRDVRFAFFTAFSVDSQNGSKYRIINDKVRLTVSAAALKTSESRASQMLDSVLNDGNSLRTIRYTEHSIKVIVCNK